MARKLADLETMMLVQDFQPQHWNWTDDEKKQLGNLDEMGKIIKSRLENAGCEILEMHGIRHDKDENKIWNEYKMDYDINFQSNHAHFIAKFKKGKGKTLPELAKIVGVEESYIEKPKSGRYAFDNMLSYLIHIKYDKKYQYDVHTVYTFAGKKYIEHYRERYESWMRGRAKKSVASTKELVDFLINGIADGAITFDNIVSNEEWMKVYIINSSRIDTAIIAREKAIKQQKLLNTPNYQESLGQK